MARLGYPWYQQCLEIFQFLVTQHKGKTEIYRKKKRKKKLERILEETEEANSLDFEEEKDSFCYIPVGISFSCFHTEYPFTWSSKLLKKNISPKLYSHLNRNSPQCLKIFRISIFLLLLYSLPMLSSSSSEEPVCRTEVDYRDIYSVNCSQRNLEDVPNDLHVKTWELNLDYNMIKLIKSIIYFARYDELRNLSLRQNSIEDININAFTGLVNLIALDLKGNMLTTIPTEALKSLPALETLILSGNNIQHISQHAFPTLKELSTVKLDKNRLFVIDDYALTSLVSLRSLSIQNNILQSLSSRALYKSGQDLETLHLYNNPWQCDCKLRWLRDWVERSYRKWPSNTILPICSGPHINSRKDFMKVPEHQFACKIMMYSSGTSLKIQAGTNVNLTCRLYSDPPAEMIWLHNDRRIRGDSKDDHFRIVEYLENIQNLVLTIKNFQKKDIGFYKCLARNPMGRDSVTYKVNLELNPNRLPLEMETKKTIFNAKTAIICSVAITLVLIVLLMLLLVFRHIKNQRKRQEKLRITIEDLFEKKNRSDVKNRSCDEDQMDMGEMDPLYQTVVSDGNYVSFKSDPVDSEDVSQLYTSNTRFNETNSELEPNNTSCWLQKDHPFSESASPLLGSTLSAQNTPTHQSKQRSNIKEVQLTTFPRNTIGSYSSFKTGPPHYVTNRRHKSNNNDNEEFYNIMINQEPLNDYLFSKSQNPNIVYNSSYDPIFGSKNKVLPFAVSPVSSDGCPKRSVTFTSPQIKPKEDTNKRYSSVGSLGSLAPRKPPRFYSRSSVANGDINSPVSSPTASYKDEFGTAV